MSQRDSATIASSLQDGHRWQVIPVGDRPQFVGQPHSWGISTDLRQPQLGTDPCWGFLVPPGRPPHDSDWGQAPYVGRLWRRICASPLGWGQTPCWGIPNVCFAVRDRLLSECWTCWSGWTRLLLKIPVGDRPWTPRMGTDPVVEGWSGHEVPGIASPRKGCPVGYGVTVSRRFRKGPW